MASMSNLREELSKLAATFKTSGNTTRHCDSFKNIHTVLPLLDPRGQATETMRNAAAVEVLADAFTLAATAVSADFDLYEGIVKAAKDRRVTIAPDAPTFDAKHTSEIGVRAKTPQIDMMIFGSPGMLSGLPLNYAEAGMAALLLDLCYPETLLEAEVRESLRQIQRRDDVIEKTWQAIKSHTTIHEVSWVPGHDGSTKRAEVRKPADKLPEAAAGIVKALEAAQKNRSSAIEHNTRLEADLKASRETLSKCMQAMETCEVGKPGEELATCRRIADKMQRLNKEIQALYSRRGELETAKRDAEQALQGEKTKFAEYRRNVELRDNAVADLRRRLEIASIGDRIVVQIDHTRGQIVIEGWKVESEALRQALERSTGKLMTGETLSQVVDAIRSEILKIDRRMYRESEICDRRNYNVVDGIETAAIIRVNGQVRDEVAFRGLGPAKRDDRHED